MGGMVRDRVLGLWIWERAYAWDGVLKDMKRGREWRGTNTFVCCHNLFWTLLTSGS